MQLVGSFDGAVRTDLLEVQAKGAEDGAMADSFCVVLLVMSSIFGRRSIWVWEGKEINFNVFLVTSVSLVEIPFIVASRDGELTEAGDKLISSL